MKQCEPQPAAVFVCDECGRDSFFRMVRAEEMPPEEDGEWLRMPKGVTCQHCGERYEVVIEGEDWFDQDDQEDDVEGGA